MLYKKNGEEDARKPKNFAKLDESDVTRALDFVQGAVYCWCASQPGVAFSVHTLFGKDNEYWQNTPLQSIYDAYNKVAAAYAVGHLLNRCLFIDSREVDVVTRKTLNEFKLRD